jgi:hypothetical protein
MRIYMILALLTINLYAEIDVHHEHLGTTELKVHYDYLDFENSKQKDDGRRYGVEIDHQSEAHHAQIYLEHTDTNTQAHVHKDLKVDQLALKYQYELDNKNKLIFSYVHIKDNLMEEVDDGDIYGFGYKYKVLTLTQYLSKYKNFSVYQTDAKWGMKKEFSNVSVRGAIIGKYIYLQDRLSNDLSKKADEEYTTVGLKIHADYEGWHAGAGLYMGDRIFAVMNDGLKVQHHAMEFSKSYMFSISKEFGNTLIALRYIKQFAKEVPIDNDNVKVSNISVKVEYRF